jgi:hypothetical protein
MTLPRPASPSRPARAVHFASPLATASTPTLPVLAHAAGAASVKSPADAAANAGFMAERGRRAAAHMRQAVQVTYDGLVSNLISPSDAVERLGAAYTALVKPNEKATGAEPLTPLALAQRQKAVEAKRLADDARTAADTKTQKFVDDWPLGKGVNPRDIATALQNLAALYLQAEATERPVLAAAHAAAGLGMTAQCGKVHAKIVDRSPMTVELSMQAKAITADCKIQAIFPRKMTDDGLLVVDIHHPGRDGFRAPGEDRLASQQAFTSRVVVPHDAYGVRLGETEIRLTDFSAPASAPEAAAAGTSDTAPAPLRSPQ